MKLIILQTSVFWSVWTSTLLRFSSFVCTSAFVVTNPALCRRKELSKRKRRCSTKIHANGYDQWRSDGFAPFSLPLTEDNVNECLELLIESDYGEQMFGCRAKAASIGISGSISLLEIEGPIVTLTLDGEFWHKRSTVLGKAAIWLNACMPEIVEVNVAEMSELEDYEDYRDEDTGELLYIHDKRSADYNGDRGTMEYQGIDPDIRGPFPSGTQGFNINPA